MQKNKEQKRFSRWSRNLLVSSFGFIILAGIAHPMFALISPVAIVLAIAYWIAGNCEISAPSNDENTYSIPVDLSRNLMSVRPFKADIGPKDNWNNLH
jgi:hypothetical protein